jgi:hypothetical protein
MDLEQTEARNNCAGECRARHSTTLYYMRLTDHVTLNFNNSLCPAAVFLDIEKAFDTCHLGKFPCTGRGGP